jgi:hypothetical protein
MFLGIFFNGDLLFLSESTGPKFDFTKLLFLVFLGLFSLLLEYILIELNDSIVVDSFWIRLEVLDLFLIDFLKSLDLKNIQDFLSLGFTFSLKCLKKGVSLNSLGISNLLLLLLSLLSSNSEFLLSKKLSFLS